MIPQSDAKRKYPRFPRIGVGALVFHDDQFLLVKRGQEPQKGMWTVPGGLIELGEKIEDALSRELKEECGVTVRDITFLSQFEFIENDNEGRVRYHYVVLEFFADYLSGQLCAGDDCVQALWFDHVDVDDLAISESTLCLIEKALSARRNLRIQGN